MTLPRRYWIIFCLASGGCTTQRYLTTPIHQAESDFKDHIGFVLYDPVARKSIYQHQGDRYFTPASNTKIFTFFAALRLLGDSIPALRYEQRGDTLIFWGTGDPAFLYKNCSCAENRAYRFLKDSPSFLFFSSDNFHTDHFGPGWAWDDYGNSYQVEKNPFPIYGNRSAIKKTDDSFISFPPVFNYTVADSSRHHTDKSTMVRSIDSNDLIYTPGKSGRPREWSIPFHYSDTLLARLLTDTLHKEVKLISRPMSPGSKILYSLASDSLYKVMMQESDNFIAEQLLLVCSQAVSDTLSSEIAIEYIKKNFLFDLQDEPLWVDGSGLSRYNLFTPRSIVRLWEKIYGLIPRDRLFRLLAVGGESGTIRNHYNGAPKPYIVGKTGTLSNNHSLSGYLVTKRGRTLIFSWMNNNFATNAGEVRDRMEMVLRNVYEKY